MKGMCDHQRIPDPKGVREPPRLSICISFIKYKGEEEEVMDISDEAPLSH